MIYGSGGRRLSRRSGPAVSERARAGAVLGARSAVGPSPSVEVTWGGGGCARVSLPAPHGRFERHQGRGGGVWARAGVCRRCPCRCLAYWRRFTGFGEAVLAFARQTRATALLL